MNFEKLINDSLGYTRDTFTGHWGRWLIFVLLGLPFSPMRFVIDPETIITGAEIHWELNPVPISTPRAERPTPGCAGTLHATPTGSPASGRLSRHPQQALPE